MASLSRGLRGLFALALALAGLLGHAQQAVPALTGPVVDQAHVLDAAQSAALRQQLGALEQRSGAQVAVLTVDSTLPEDIADFTQRVADEWKLGRAQIGDGVLVVLAVKDRRVRIAVAKTLEGAIPDLEARRIITQAMAPRFQQGDYAGGLQAGVARLAALIQHEALPAPASAPSASHGTSEDGAPWWLAALMAWFIGSSVLRALFGRKAGALLTGSAAGGLAWWVTGSVMLGLGTAVAAAVLALVFGAASLLKGLGGGGLRRGGPVIFGSGLPGGWGGGGGWSGGGGGGWRSGGGGDFGGGGASGNW